MLHTAKYMHQILNLSLDAYEEIFKEIDTKGLVEKKGIIYVWTNKNLKSRNLEIKIRDDLGIKQKHLTQKEILELEPNLNPVFDLHRFVDYDMQFDKSFVEPLKNIVQLINWNVEPVASLDTFFA